MVGQSNGALDGLFPPGRIRIGRSGLQHGEGFGRPTELAERLGLDRHRRRRGAVESQHQASLFQGALKVPGIRKGLRIVTTGRHMGGRLGQDREVDVEGQTGLTTSNEAGGHSRRGFRFADLQCVQRRLDQHSSALLDRSALEVGPPGGESEIGRGGGGRDERQSAGGVALLGERHRHVGQPRIRRTDLERLLPRFERRYRVAVGRGHDRQSVGQRRQFPAASLPRHLKPLPERRKSGIAGESSIRGSIDGGSGSRGDPGGEGDISGFDQAQEDDVDAVAGGSSEALGRLIVRPVGSQRAHQRRQIAGRGRGSEARGQ